MKIILIFILMFIPLLHVDSNVQFSNNTTDNYIDGRWIKAKVTAYTPWDEIDSNSGYQDGYTSTMVDTQSTDPNKIYGIAADPRAIPYGTKVYVPGYWESLQNNKISVPTKMTIVDDTGGKLRQSWNDGILHIDIRYRTNKAAKNWGVKHIEIFIFDN
jgi:3D (Asp-Asp-Asp) domain-containing protein